MENTIGRMESFDQMEKYLRDHYEDEITNLMNLPNDREHLPIHVDMCRLQQRDFDLFEAILSNAQAECAKWDQALLAVQKYISEEKDAFLEPDYRIKEYCHVRFVHLPESDARYKQPFPNNDQIGQFLEVKGNVVRMSQAKLLELKREYACNRCSNSKVIEADYIRTYAFDVPKQCASPTCNGMMRPKYDQPLPKYCIEYQEIKLQEPTGISNVPKSLLVTLEHDLVSTCQPGDSVTVCGTIERRWYCTAVYKPTIAMRAISLTHEQKRMTIDAKRMMEQMVLMQMEWNESLEQLGELRVRDMIVKSICPEIYGMYPIKLAIALAVCSGGIENTTTASTYGLSHRGQSHLLLIGDPGLAKSRLLLSAAAFAPRAIHTTGMGCSSAGLTAAAVKEDGEWQLEAGALVLADGGICCIDEFNLMRATDRASIHEAMEQQTISMAKAGMVCKLSTRCAILAAANPKNLFTMSEPGGTSTLNLGIDSPLLSRFDLVYILTDERNEEWDSRIADHLLDLSSRRPRPKQRDDELWPIEKLQTHFVAIRNIHPQMTDEANKMLGAYYRRCRNDPQRDLGRTTVRLLDSLTRLAKAHARLLFRDRVSASDAAMVIRLMESTYGFGRILQPFHVIREELPLGPSTADISDVYRVLNLGNYRVTEEPEENQHVANSTGVEIVNNRTESSQVSVQRLTQLPPHSTLLSKTGQNELDEILDFDFENAVDRANDLDAIGSQTFNVPSVSQAPEMAPVPVIIPDESAVKKIADEDMDVDDAILSQALEQVEETRHRMSLSTFKFPKTKSVVVPGAQEATTSRRVLNNPSPMKSPILPPPPKKPAHVRNRLLLTQSDDSDDDEPGIPHNRNVFNKSETAVRTTSKLSTQTINRLNVFQNPNVLATNAKDEQPSTSVNKEEDSAYDTMNTDDFSSAADDRSQIVAPTPPIAASNRVPTFSKRDDETDDDLSCLDFDV